MRSLKPGVQPRVSNSTFKSRSRDLFRSRSRIAATCVFGLILLWRGCSVLRQTISSDPTAWLPAVLAGMLVMFSAIPSYAVKCCTNVDIINFGPNINAQTTQIERITDETIVNYSNLWIRDYRPVSIGGNGKSTKGYPLTDEGYEAKALRKNNGLVKSGANGSADSCPAVQLKNIKTDNAPKIAEEWEKAGKYVACTIETNWREKLRPLEGWQDGLD